MRNVQIITTTNTANQHKNTHTQNPTLYKLKTDDLFKQQMEILHNLIMLNITNSEIAIITHTNTQTHIHTPSTPANENKTQNAIACCVYANRKNTLFLIAREDEEDEYEMKMMK